MNWIPLLDKREKFEKQLATANTLAERVEHLIDRGRFFNKIGAVNVKWKKFQWLVDLTRDPFHTVYILPDDEFCYCFTIGVNYYYPHLTDLCLMIPSLQPEDDLEGDDFFEYNARTCGNLANYFIRNQKSGKFPVIREGDSVKHLMPLVDESEIDAYESLFVDDWVEPCKDVKPYDKYGVDLSMRIPKEKKFYDYDGYQEFGRTITMKRPDGRFFRMTDCEVHGFCGLYVWFNVNFRDKQTHDMLCIKLPKIRRRKDINK